MTSTIFGEGMTFEVEVISDTGEKSRLRWTPDHLIQLELTLIRGRHPEEFNRVITLVEQTLKQSVVLAAVVVITLGTALRSGAFQQTLDRLIAETDMPPTLASVVDQRNPFGPHPFDHKSTFDTNTF